MIDGAFLNADKDHDERRIRTLRAQVRASVSRALTPVLPPTGLTEANNSTESMTVKPGSGNTRNAETRYKICVECGEPPSRGVDALRCFDTHPKAAVNKPRLDEESENLFDSDGDASFTHILLHGDTVMPMNSSGKK